MIFLVFAPTLHDLLFRRTCNGVGWGGDNTRPNRSVAPLHDLLDSHLHATWTSTSTSQNMSWGGVGWECYQTDLLLRYMIFLVFTSTLHDLLLHRTCHGVGMIPNRSVALLHDLLGFTSTVHELLLLLHRTCHGVGWGGDDTKQICCSATWSSCFSPLRYMSFYFTEHVMGWGGVGWGGDDTKQICCSATWSSWFSPLRYMIFYFTEHVMGWGGVGMIPNRSVARPHDLLGCTSTLHELLLHWTCHGVGWGGVGMIPNKSFAPLHGFLGFHFYATWSSISQNMSWGGVGSVHNSGVGKMLQSVHMNLVAWQLRPTLPEARTCARKRPKNWVSEELTPKSTLNILERKMTNWKEPKKRCKYWNICLNLILNLSKRGFHKQPGGLFMVAFKKLYIHNRLVRFF